MLQTEKPGLSRKFARHVQKPDLPAAFLCKALGKATRTMLLAGLHLHAAPVDRGAQLSWRSLVTDELQHKLFKAIAQHPHISQRELSKILGISLGKANYCLKALVEKGWIKAQNFKNNKNKLSYAYLLTPSGIEEKARVTVRYLKRKMEEYDQLKAAVEELKREVEMEEIA
ncbi:MAG: hypothetical protein OHK0011_18530 [Turneriella sp.]